MISACGDHSALRGAHRSSNRAGPFRADAASPFCAAQVLLDPLGCTFGVKACDLFRYLLCHNGFRILDKVDTLGPCCPRLMYRAMRRPALRAATRPSSVSANSTFSASRSARTSASTATTACTTPRAHLLRARTACRRCRSPRGSSRRSRPGATSSWTSAYGAVPSVKPGGRPAAGGHPLIELLRRLAERNQSRDANALTVPPQAFDDFFARFGVPGRGRGRDPLQRRPHTLAAALRDVRRAETPHHPHGRSLPPPRPASSQFTNTGRQLCLPSGTSKIKRCAFIQLLCALVLSVQ